MAEGMSAQQYWEDFYRERQQIWSGRVNPLLVREVAELPPGTALDLGSGEGGDAIWLAEQGWSVTAVDIAATALERGRARAAEFGVAARITWLQHDLSKTFPTGVFDLVSAQFLHSPVGSAEEREAILRRASEAVAVDGRLLIVGHAGWPTWVDAPPFEHHFHPTQEVLKAVDFDPRRWQIEVEEVVTRELVGPEGQSGTRDDNVLRLKRTG